MSGLRHMFLNFLVAYFGVPTVFSVNITLSCLGFGAYSLGDLTNLPVSSSVVDEEGSSPDYVFYHQLVLMPPLSVQGNGRHHNGEQL